MRRVPLKAALPADHRSEAGYREWHAPIFGQCANCGTGPQRLERHHAIHEQHVRLEGGAPWDLRNSIALGVHLCRCHSRHTTAAERLPVSLVGPVQLGFALELLGEDRTALYLARYYRVG